MPLALMILVPECDRFSVVFVQSCVCDRGMPDVSGYFNIAELIFFRDAKCSPVEIVLEYMFDRTVRGALVVT